MKSKSIYDKKAIILDLDFAEINQYNLDDILSTNRLLNEISANQTLILLTQNTIQDSEKMLNDLNIKTGYLIAESGAVTLNIATRKVIFESFLSSEFTLRLTNKCIWNNLNFSINTKENHTFPWIINNWIIRKYKSNLSRLFHLKKNELLNTTNIKSCIENNQIYSCEVYFLDKKESDKEANIKNLIKDLSSFEKANYFTYKSSLYISNANATKYDSIKKLFKQINLDLNKDTIYLGIHQLTPELCKHCYFSALTKYVIDSSDTELTKNSDTISGGESSWINWLYDNSHLWIEDNNEHLNKLLSRGLTTSLSARDIQAISAGITKYLRVSLSNKDIFRESSRSEKIFKSLFKNKGRNNNILVIAFWPRQISAVLKYLDRLKNE
ncbi:hypothetical protein A6V39_02565 [Candidatus Mycoplasma haematobovis]|uniref:Uncharacterized protein n=1 Tax=Candidatus Mycoplasma haematobovis TaxID=432608 RepID=A0A1A9QDH5_9MOLU|nr:HAD hydrolase family protein [Candidatus Mycoplasma haematobovis]OAL10298.1 hypothetical protein A6V39_02565 [Candidatus Mycoplasma haematobovis]